MGPEEQHSGELPGFSFYLKDPRHGPEEATTQNTNGHRQKGLSKILFSLDKVPGKGQHAKTDNFYIRMALIQLTTIEKSVAPQIPSAKVKGGLDCHPI